MIKRSQIQSLAEVVGQFSSPELIFCAKSYFRTHSTHVTMVACKRPWSFLQRCKWPDTAEQACTLDPKKVQGADCYPSRVWGTSGKQAHALFVRDAHPLSSQITVPLCRLVLGLKEWKWYTGADLHFKNKIEENTVICQIFHTIWACKKKAITPTSALQMSS